MSQSESGAMDLVRNGAMGVGILLCVGLIGAQFVGGDDDDAAEVNAAERDATVERIQPVATVNIAGQAAETTAAEAAPVASDTSAASAAEPAPAADGAATAAAPAVIDGEAIYKASCLACHGSGAAGAPIVGDSAAWAARIATGQDALVASALNGKGAMPPKGGAMNRSDEEITAVVVYMIEASQ